MGDRQLLATDSQSSPLGDVIQLGRKRHLALKTRVLEILATLKPAGAENVVLSLARGVDRSRFEIAVVSLYDAFPGGLEPLFDKYGVRVWHLGKWRGPDPRMYARLHRIVREFKPDVIHSHCYVTRYTFALRARAMVHTVHNLATSEVDTFGRFFHRYAFRRGVVPVAVGAAVADSVQRVYGSPPLATIPNGIDIEQFWRPQARQQWRRENRFREDDLLVVSVGRLDPQKNPLALANAIANVPNAQLLMVGQGTLRTSLDRRPGVHLLGVRSDIADILAAADIFALASDWEGLPLAVLEAMAAGLPIVATRVGCIPEIVAHGSTGLLVPPRDEDSLVAALCELAGDANRRKRMGAAGRARSLSFAADKMVIAYERLFDQLLTQPRQLEEAVAAKAM
jgi:glycosyltransferase involved in cell wall biosynthesis